jgi:hypothetical protein
MDDYFFYQEKRKEAWCLPNNWLIVVGVVHSIVFRPGSVQSPGFGF